MLEVISILAVILGLSVLVVIHEAGHFLAAKWSGLLVEEFGFGLPPRFWGKKIGETIYSFNWLPFGGFVKIYGEKHELEKSGLDIKRSFSHQTVLKRVIIIASGVLMNFLSGWMLISAVYMIGIPQALLVTEVRSGSIAELAGIKKGDQFPDFKAISEFKSFIDANKGKEIFLNIKRVDEIFSVKTVPRLNVPEGEGNLGVFLSEVGLPQEGFFKSVGRGFLSSVVTVGMIFLSLADLIVGIFTNIKILEFFVGPVGIVNIAIETAKLGAVNFLQLLSLISLNLAVFNIIPIPALDGGRLLFLAIEKIRGRAINPETEMAVNGLGFAFLLFLILAITVKDILTLL